MSNSKNNKLFVERETYEYKGKEYFAYFIRGTVRGKEVKASVRPQDINGYTVLDIVFADKNKVDLVVKPYEITDEASGNVITGNMFSAQSIDENGEVYECPVKHSRPSDKALLNMLVK